MPSPFPGMDPYLESDLWTTLHSSLANAIVAQLAPQLKPKYVAVPTERFVVEDPEDVAIETSSIIPDVAAVKGLLARTRKASQTEFAAAPLHLATIVNPGIPHTNVEIRDTKRRRLVTAIETLSPTNKRGRGHRKDLAKRQRILDSSAHLIEIDLVRSGTRMPMREPLPDQPYFVLVSRVEKRPILDVWPIGFRDPLPTVPVPLLKNDADASLALQNALSDVYDLIGYELMVDYSKPPDNPLPKSVVPWANTLLRKAKLQS
jgi:Protein of unknown function (DUF4058)